MPRAMRAVSPPTMSPRTTIPDGAGNSTCWERRMAAAGAKGRARRAGPEAIVDGTLLIGLTLGVRPCPVGDGCTRPMPARNGNCGRLPAHTTVERPQFSRSRARSAGGDLPVDGVLGPVGAPRPGAHGVVEVAGELLVDGGDVAEGGPGGPP